MKSLLIALLLFTSAFGQQKDAVPVLKTLDGNTYIMYEAKKYMASVFVFLLPDCPASQNYSLTLNQLSLKYKSNKIQFYGVFPSFVKHADIVQFQKEYHVSFPILIDDNKSLMKNLKAHIAPEVFVVDQQSKVRYSGRIDNWMFTVGQKRTVITTHELQDALEAIIHGKTIAVAKTQAVGCIID